jgi:hypothetical protein|tara:strand:+ start:732 stop:1709 length:978 start_codon:yes stop_codon:yes gene_type:complete
MAEAAQNLSEKDPDQEEMFEIEVIDDTPQEDQPFVKDDQVDDEELQNYGKRAQDRIGQLKREFHDERREKEKAARLMEESVNVSKNLHQQNQQLRQALQNGNKALFEVTASKIDADVEATQALLKEAHENGDVDKIVEMQTKLNEIIVDRQRTAQLQQQQEQQYQQAAQASQQQPQVPEVTLTQKDTDWIRNNPWFQRNEELTGFAMGLHKRLVQNGVHPQGDDYYRLIDSEMRKVFDIDAANEKYKNGETLNAGDLGIRGQSQSGDDSVEIAPENTAAPVVAPATRNSGRKPSRQVKLTRSQVALARKLGITNEQYATQMLKDN